MNEKNGFSRSRWLILLLFGTIGQIAWTVENMYFNLFVIDEIKYSLTAVTLMVQLSGIMATLATLIAGTLSDKSGNRRSFISYGYIIWGITVALFGYISPSLAVNLFGVEMDSAVKMCLIAVIAGDCVMTLFGSTANDASFNAWVTDNTESSYRGKVEGVLAILPLLAMIIVAGGFGMLVEGLGYATVFLILGIVISLSGVAGIFIIKDNEELKPSGSMKDIFYGFKPSVVKGNIPFYLTLLVVLIYGITCQIFMPYLIIYMKSYLGFGTLEYSIIFGLAISVGAGVNLYLTRLSDRLDKTGLLRIAAIILSAGLLAMYLSRGFGHTANLITFGISGCVMIVGYIFISALSGSLVRDYTPEGEVGKLQGVRMVFSVLIPMVAGPMIGNGINAIRKIPLQNPDQADTLTTAYIPAPEIFLAGAIFVLLILAVIPFLKRATSRVEK